MLWLFQIVILVVDSTDRERLTVTKEELHRMLTHEVKKKTNKKEQTYICVCQLKSSSLYGPPITLYILTTAGLVLV